MTRPSPLSRLVAYRLPGRLEFVLPEVMLLIGLVALLLAPNVGLRDLAGDEIHMLKGGFWQIWILSMDPSHPFTGHLPWSFWLRECSLLIFPDHWPVAWRLHSALAIAACVGLMTWLCRESFGRGWALFLGALLAIHPLMLFHGQDATNYAWSALTGAMLIGALHHSKDGQNKAAQRWLVVALCLGSINDYWFAFPAAAALVLGVCSAWRAEPRSERFRQLWRAWRIPLGLAVAIGGSLVARGGTDAVVSSHAEAQQDSALPVLLDVPWRLMNRLNGVALDGLEAGRSSQIWESWPPILLTAVALGLVLWRGSSIGKRAASIVLVSLGLVMVMGMGLQIRSGQALPLEPRSFMVLLPLLMLVWVEALRLQSNWVGRGSALLLFALIATPSWKQMSRTSSLQNWAAEQISAEVSPGDWVIAPEPLSWRLDLPDDVELRTCLPPGVPDAQRIWWVRLQDGSRPLSMDACPDSDEGPVDLSAYSLIHVTAQGPPEHERNAASFLPPVIIARYDLGYLEPHSEVVRNLNVSGGWWSGLGSGTLRIRVETGETSALLTELQPSIQEPLVIPMVDDPLAIRVELVPDSMNGIPDWSLFDPYRRTVQGWEPRPLSAVQAHGEWNLAAPPFGSPAWQVTRRLLRVILVMAMSTALWAALFRRRTRKLRNGENMDSARLSSDEYSVSPRDSSKPWPWWVIASAATVLVIVWWRIHQQPMDAFGDSAAQYIDHLARMQALERVVMANAWSPWSMLLAGDGMYPPLLHLFTLGVSGVVGHGAGMVVSTGVLWLLLLAWAMVRIARVLQPSCSSPALVGLAIVWTPALHAVTTRYAYDLPMTALLWVSVAGLASAGEAKGRWTWVMPLLAGFGLAASALLKWTALPFGLVMFVGLWASLGRLHGWRFITERTVLAIGVASVIVMGFLYSGGSSMGAMGSATFQPPVGEALDSRPWLQSLISGLPDGVGDRIGSMMLQLLHLDADRLAFYPVRLVTTIFSPLLMLPLLLGLGVWWRSGRPGMGLVLTTIFGQWIFCLLLVPPLDDRFLLTLAPALTLVAALGWLKLEPQIRRLVNPVVLVAALWVAGDFHLRAPKTHLHLDPSTPLSDEQNGMVWRDRVGLSSSVYLRGWSRSDEMQSDRSALRERLWDAVRLCHAPVVAGPSALLTAWGDSNWWAWRDLVARADAGLKDHPMPWVTYLERRVDVPIEDIRPQLMLTPEPIDVFGTATVVPDPRVWETLGVLLDPEGGPGIRMWQLQSGGVCPETIAK